MRFILVCFIAVGCACNNSVAPNLDAGEGAVGPQGPKGDQGEKGDTGLQGPAGIQGPQGVPGGALVNINDISSDSHCPNGGVSLVEADGGGHYICNAAPGTKGDRGDVGPAGTQGVQGPAGPPVQSMSFFGIDGGLVGQALMNPSGNNPLDMVYVKDIGCITQVNIATQRLEVVQGSILYTGPNCTGTPFVSQNYFVKPFPMGCVGVGTTVWKAMQPLMLQQMNSQSRYVQQFVNADGGQVFGCEAFVSGGGYGVAAQQVTMPNIQGPFTFGMP